MSNEGSSWTTEVLSIGQELVNEDGSRWVRVEVRATHDDAPSDTAIIVSAKVAVRIDPDMSLASVHTGARRAFTAALRELIATV